MKKNTLKQSVILVLLLIVSSITFGQITYSGSPTSNPSSCPSSDVLNTTCGTEQTKTFYGGILKAYISKISGSQVTIRVSKCNTGNFSGTLYLKSNDVCGIVVLPSPKLSTVSTYDFVINVDHLGDKNYRVTYNSDNGNTSPAYKKYYSDNIKITGTCNSGTNVNPANIAFSNIKTSQATATWPSVPGAIGYRINYTTCSGTYIQQDLATSSNSYTLTGLAENTKYKIQTRTVFPNNCFSTWSGSSSCFTTALSCGMPNASLSTATNLSINGFTANWQAVSGASYYRINVRKSTETDYSKAVSFQTTNNSTSYAIKGLECGLKYFFQVQAVCSSGDGTWSASNPSEINLGTVGIANSPSSSFSNITSSSFTATWPVVSGAIGYEVNYTTCAGTYALLGLPTNSNSITISNLNPSTSYKIQVRAKFGTNCHGTWGGSSNCITTLTAPNLMLTECIGYSQFPRTVQGSTVNTNLKLRNDGGDFMGTLYLSLHNSAGNYIMDLGTWTGVSIAKNGVYSSSIKTSAAINEAISNGYKIYAKYSTNGSDYSTIGTGTTGCNNPFLINIMTSEPKLIKISAIETPIATHGQDTLVYNRQKNISISIENNSASIVKKSYKAFLLKNGKLAPDYYLWSKEDLILTPGESIKFDATTDATLGGLVINEPGIYQIIVKGGAGNLDEITLDSPTLNTANGIKNPHNIVIVQPSFRINTIASPVEGGIASITDTNKRFHLNQICRIQATPATNYIFKGWEKDGVIISDNPSYDLKVTADATLKAIFELNEVFEITTEASPIDGGTVQIIDPDNKYFSGELCTSEAIAATNHILIGWYKNGELVSKDENYSFEVTESATITAVFELNEVFEITTEASPSEGGTAQITDSDKSYLLNEICNTKAIPNDRYQFMGWFRGDDFLSSELDYSFPTTENAVLTAKFEEINLSTNQFVNSKFDIFPNPITNILTITQNLIFKIENIKIYNNSGKLITDYRIINDGSTLSLDVSKLPNSVYHVIIKYAGGYETKKIIKSN